MCKKQPIIRTRRFRVVKEKKEEDAPKHKPCPEAINLTQCVSSNNGEILPPIRAVGLVRRHRLRGFQHLIRQLRQTPSLSSSRENRRMARATGHLHQNPNSFRSVSRSFSRRHINRFLSFSIGNHNRISLYCAVSLRFPLTV